MSIRELEDKLMHEDDYKYFVDQIKGMDNHLVAISRKFADFTRDVKEILDGVKEKSE